MDHLKLFKTTTCFVSSNASSHSTTVSSRLGCKDGKLSKTIKEEYEVPSELATNSNGIKVRNVPNYPSLDDQLFASIEEQQHAAY